MMDATVAVPGPKIKLGTCSWNYDSWIGLVYTKKCSKSARYLKEYSKEYETAEIDSRFYKIPTPLEASEYLEHAGKTLRFTCTVPQEITLTHKRNFNRSTP